MEQFSQLVINPAMCGMLAYKSNSIGANSLLLYNTASLYKSLSKNESNSRVPKTKRKLDYSVKQAERGDGSPSTSSDGEQDFRYAGPKFSHAPMPGDLPKPPTHWMAKDVCSDISKVDIKMIEKVSRNVSNTKGRINSHVNAVDIEELTSYLKQILKVE